jgi:hypothetical protein
LVQVQRLVQQHGQQELGQQRQQQQHWVQRALQMMAMKTNLKAACRMHSSEEDN